ncbi:MAG: hypothetical protein OIF56_00135 [Cohaesibacter sp.]|nr:hypothetical protein [Cohaesibacter sp.]
MSVLRIMQPAFVAGLLSSTLWSRVDLAKYATGLKRAENILIHTHGGASNRAGLIFVGETKNSQPARQIPFDYDVETDQTYNLVFTDRTLRIFRQGAPLLSGRPGEANRTPLEWATPYRANELDQLVAIQEKDVVYLAHRNHAPRKLARHGDTEWRLSVMDFSIQMTAPTGVAVVMENGVDGHKDNVTYRYKVSALHKRTKEESLPCDAVAVDNDLTTAGHKNKLTWTAHADASKYVIYKEDNGLYGLAGTTTATSFIDQNITADLSDAPQEVVNPFEGTGNYPGAAGFFEQRLVLASTRNNPSAVDLSQSANYENFSAASPAKASDAIAFRIPSANRNQINAVVDMQRGLAVFGSAGEWVVKGSSDGFLSPSNPLIRKQSSYGSSQVQPIQCGKSILYAQARGGVIREFDYDYASDGYDGPDLTILARDLFAGKEVKSWAYAQAPHSIVPVVFDDGSCAVMTYMKKHQIWAWTEFKTKGHFEDVTVIAEGHEDVIYFVVRRQINGTTRRYIEKMHTRDVSKSEECFFVDSGLSYRGKAVDQVVGLDHLEGQTVVALADGNVIRGLVVKKGAIRLPHKAAIIHAGLPYETVLQTLDLDLGMVKGLGTVQGRKKSVGSIALRLEKSRGLWIGPDEDNLHEWKQRTNEDWNEATRLLSGIVHFNPSGRWSEGANTIVKQKDPLPMTVLSIMPEVVTGG